MAKYSHQHPFTNLRLALSFVCLFGFPFAILDCFGSRYSSYYSDLNFLPLHVINAVLFLIDFLVSLVDIIVTSQPRRLDAPLDAFAGAGYLAIFIVGSVFSSGGIATFLTVAASAIHIFACVKNANPRNRVHWMRDASIHVDHAATGRAPSRESFLL